MGQDAHEKRVRGRTVVAHEDKGPTTTVLAVGLIAKLDPGIGDRRNELAVETDGAAKPLHGAAVRQEQPRHRNNKCQRRDRY